MRKHFAELLLLGILALGLGNISMILFRGHFVQEMDEATGLIQKSSLLYPFDNKRNKSIAKARPVAMPYAGPSSPYPQAVLPPDGVTGATPRVIAMRIETIIQSLRRSVVGVRGGGGGAAPLWTQALGATPAPTNWNMGSGVVIHPSGFIVTNYHVVALGPDIRVSVFTQAGYKDYPGVIISADPAKDLALLKIVPSSPLTAIPIGDSDLARTGDQVIGVGNPFGLTQSVTKGIISAKRRAIVIGNQSMANLIQTDVPISPGNSGGALCNLRGQLIGINVAIYSPRESVYSGVSLAIPVNEVKLLYGNYMDFTQKPVDFQPFLPNGQTRNVAIALPNEALVANPARIPLAKKIMPSPGEGIEEIAWLGIDMTPEEDGVGIDEIEGISPMEAGLQAGDILKSLNGMPTPDMYALKEAIKKVPLRTGEAVVMDVYRPRDNRNLYINFRLKKWDIRGR
ncbi:MAG: trypsin-like peptidase domain-containing protein [Elusimicrobiota bacterium]|nr:trypsin-like peptidase domain-containing protein [Elusimicrobiota bacterium]